LLLLLIMGKFHIRVLQLQEDAANDDDPKLALFGPGIESPYTKHLVHKMVTSHTSLFDATGFISGLPGGFGSGVKIDMRKSRAFDLVCLYTNSAKVREGRAAATRLNAANNLLLVGDVVVGDAGGQQSSPALHPSVLRLLPTLDALVFSLDATGLAEMSADERSEALHWHRTELELMTGGLSTVEAGREGAATPVLVLCCRREGAGSGARGVWPTPAELANGLGLRRSDARPWAAFEVDIESMDGLARALDWILYHCQKKRSSLRYHRGRDRR
jgi:hypothetical protein